MRRATNPQVMNRGEIRPTQQTLTPAQRPQFQRPYLQRRGR